MAFGEITKQLAQQALGDALRTPEAPPPASKSATENSGSIILAQIQAMQKALKPEEELVIQFNAGTDTIRILEIFAPSWQVIVLSGIDSDKNVTRVISHADNLQLICKVMKSRTPEKPIRVGITTPKNPSLNSLARTDAAGPARGPAARGRGRPLPNNK